MILASGLLAIGLALTHIVAARLPSLTKHHRQRWLSFAGGVAVAYVFVYILPELVEYRRAVDEAVPLGFMGRHIYLLALLGICIYYGVERLALTVRWRQGSADARQADRRIFWVHVGSFALYNALVGYLLVREFEEASAKVLFAIAISLHFLVNDYALEQHHLEAYRRRGRWILAAAVIAGWAAAMAHELPEAVIAAFFAFLAGGIIVNVMKEELPEERQGRFIAFFIGAIVYTGLLLAIE